MEFTTKAAIKFNNKYDYSLVDYKNSRTKIKIICPIHGKFEQTPDCHIQSKFGCTQCGQEYATNNLIKVGIPPPQELNQKNKLSTHQFIEKANIIHSGKYDYSLSNYITTHVKVKIICKKHGEFEQKPSHHLQGKGCRKCSHDLFSSQVTLSDNEFIKRAKQIHGNKYNYEVVNYKDCYAKVKITCSKHGVFEQSPTHHLQGMGCYKCNAMESKQEVAIKDFLTQNNINYIEKDRHIISPLELDFYLPDCKIAIEVNGLRWHSELFKSASYHYNKYCSCKEKGIRLIQLWEDEIRDWFKVESYLNSQLNKTPRIYGRHCTVQVVDKYSCDKFLNQYHFLGSVNAKIRLGLFNLNRLVGVMVFNSIQSNRGVKQNNNYELVRACFSDKIIGGSAKLFKYFIKHYYPYAVVTYSDNDKFEGNSYSSLGFKQISFVAPDYKTVWKQNQFSIRKSKQTTKKQNLAKLFPNSIGTEHEICIANKIYRVYDSGKKKWEWNNNLGELR